jgi:hypothetical protein
MKKMNSFDYNPFKMPVDTDIFLMREQEKLRKTQVSIRKVQTLIAMFKN